MRSARPMACRASRNKGQFSGRGNAGTPCAGVGVAPRGRCRRFRWHGSPSSRDSCRCGTSRSPSRWDRDRTSALVGMKAVALEPDCQMHHVFVGRARMRGNEIRNEILLLSRLDAEFMKQLLETAIGADLRLHHHAQGASLGMLGGNLQVAADVVPHQLADVLRRLQCQVRSAGPIRSGPRKGSRRRSTKSI